VRIAPPLVVTADEVDAFVTAFPAIIAEAAK
jgi:acetylornithine aminotransferase